MRQLTTEGMSNATLDVLELDRRARRGGCEFGEPFGEGPPGVSEQRA
jgi:hypothetical protein